MLRKMALPLALLALSLSGAQAQGLNNSRPVPAPRSAEHPVQAEVRETILDYLAGFRDGDLAKLRRAFAPDALLIRILRDRSAPLQAIPVAPSLPAWASKPDPKTAIEDLRILLLDEKSATATFTLLYRGALYRDQLSLVQTDGEWQIAVKVTHPQ